MRLLQAREEVDPEEAYGGLGLAMVLDVLVIFHALHKQTQGVMVGVKFLMKK